MRKNRQKKHSVKIRFCRKLDSFFARSNYWFLLMAFVSGAMISCDHDDDGEANEPWEAEVERLRNATEVYKDLDMAIGDGYDMEVTGYRTQMGYHYLNVGLLDDKFEIEKPEVLIYAHDGAGELELVAVEYGIPIADLDSPQPAPEGFAGYADVWKIDTEFSLWTLHAWTVRENPNGIFTPRNPTLP